MKDMKKLYLITVVTSVLMVAVFAGARYISSINSKSKDMIRVGFVYDSDESTPYTANFIKAQKELERKLGDKVEIYVQNNVQYADGCENAIGSLVDLGCDVIFTTSGGYGETAKRFAGEHPEIQFCQATCSNANEDPVYDNYHTFMGEIYQGRYISGVVAGMKLNEMIENGEITKDEAKVGYVAAYSCDEVISGYTAFFLGVREIVPEAVMEVRYTETWSNYAVEKKTAEELIKDGCVIISQHSDTTGPAVACEEMYPKKRVYHVGYNQSMIDVAPTSSMISSRINWSPYVIGVCEALLDGKDIEDRVEGNVNGNDIGAGFEKGWIEMLELNELIAAEGSEEKIEQLEKEFKKGKNDVFKGDYIGVDPDDPANTCDLSKGYIENEYSSAPTFGYVLKDVIIIK